MRGGSQPLFSDQVTVSMWSENSFPKTRLDMSGLGRHAVLRSRTRSAA